MVNLEYYRIFYEVARAGSITAAAEKLCISQTAVSQTIRQLEEGLGSPLFVRASKGVRLRAEGEVLFSYVEKGIGSLLAGEEAFRSMVSLEQGEVKIGASDMTLRFYLLPYLEDFHAKYPSIRVQVTNGPTPETMRFLKEGRIDFGIVSSPVFDGDFVVRPVRKLRDTFVAGNRFFNLRGKKHPFALLSELPVICLEPNTSTRACVDRYLLGQGVSLKPEFELATSDMIVQFVLRNLGIGLVVKDFAEEYVRQGSLFYLEFERELPEREICIVTRKKRVMSRAAEALLGMLE